MLIGFYLFGIARTKIIRRNFYHPDNNCAIADNNRHHYKKQRPKSFAPRQGFPKINQPTPNTAQKIHLLFAFRRLDALKFLPNKNHPMNKCPHRTDCQNPENLRHSIKKIKIRIPIPRRKCADNKQNNAFRTL